LFLGEYYHSIDQKGRVAIPARFRDAFEAGIVLSRGYEKCINVYPLEEWNKVAERLASLPTTQIKVRRIIRSTFSNAFQQDLDGQGRVLIPPQLRDYAQTNGEVIVVGANSYLEIWDKNLWSTERAIVDQEASQLAESVEIWR
jgi:MraZ protein